MKYFYTSFLGLSLLLAGVGCTKKEPPVNPLEQVKKLRLDFQTKFEKNTEGKTFEDFMAEVKESLGEPSFVSEAEAKYNWRIKVNDAYCLTMELQRDGWEATKEASWGQEALGLADKPCDGKLQQ